jgi:hypothetical protein
MYERVIRHASSGAKRDRSLVPHIALVILLALALMAPIAHACSLMYRYQGFKQDLAASLTYAENHNVIPEGRAARFYALIVDAGMGKPAKTFPADGGTLVECGDGSSIELWEVAIDGDPDNPGALIRYTRADGSVFAYDTDKVECGVLLEVLGAD